MSNFCNEAEEFFKSIDPDDEETICELICDAICEPEGMSSFGYISVSIGEKGHINISNLEANGCLTYKDVEHSFTARSGDNNGFEIIAFDTHHEPYNPRHTVMPSSIHGCSDANAYAYLKLWDIHENSGLAINLLMEYMSCRYTNSPTTKPEGALAARGLEVVDGDTADHYRAKLRKQHVVHLLRDS